MAQKKQEKKGKGESNVAFSSAASLASSRGLGGSLLLGFATCEPAETGKVAVPGQTYVTPLHRLRAVMHSGNKLDWSFEPIAGSGITTTDVISMTIPDADNTQVWDFIAHIIGGRLSGETMVWVYNRCASNSDMKPVTIIGVTDITITIGSVS